MEGGGFCVSNFSYMFQWIVLKPCVLVVKILKMCLWNLMALDLILRELRPFEPCHFGSFFAL